MAQIRKTKRDELNAKITSLILENDNLLQNQEIEQSKKNQAKAVLDFAQLVIGSEEFTDRDSRIYRLGIQEAVNKILKGELAYSESMTGGAKTNIFGYYSRHGAPSELDWMVNETVKRASLNSAIQTNTETNLSSTQSAPLREIVNINPATGFNSYVLPNTTVDQKVKNFAQHLYGQLTNYVNNPYDDTKYIVKGISKEAIPNFSSYISTLNLISERTGTPEDILKLGDIVSALGNEELTEAFETYFANELDGGQEGSVSGQTTTAMQPLILLAVSKQPAESLLVDNLTLATAASVILQDVEELSNDDIITIFGGSRDESGDINDSGFLSDYTVSDMLESTHPTAVNWDLKTKLAAFLAHYLLGEYNAINALFPNNTKETQLTHTDENGNTIKLDLGNAFIRQLKTNPQLYKRILKLLLRTKIASPEKTKKLHELVNEEILKISMQKSGGVLKHIDGTFAGGVQSTEKQNLQTAPKAVDILNLSTKQKWIIGMTAASILNDLASIGTAHIPVAGPWISGSLAIAGMGVDLATDIMSGQSAKQTAINAGISGATGAAGIMVGAAKLAKAGLWAKRVGNIVKGVLGLVSIGDLASKIKDKDILNSWKKLDSPSNMTILDWINVGHSLRALANVSTNISARNRIWTDRSTAPKNPAKRLMVTRNKNNPDEKIYKEVSTEALNKALETTGKWWEFGKNKEQRINLANELAGEEYEAVLGFRGKPRTVPVREVNLVKLAERQAQSDRFTPRRQQELFGYEGYNPGPKAGDKANEWDLNINLKLPGQTIKPIVVNKAKYNGKEIKIYGITKQDMESGKISQIAPDLVRLSTKGWPKSVLDALPKDTKEIWYSRKNGNIVYVSLPKSNRNGDKLDKLQNYINNKNGK